MGTNTRKLTLCAMMAALATVLLMAGALPLATYCGPILAMLPLAVTAEEAGFSWAVGTYAVVTVLGAVVVPEPEAVLVFACTGSYPALKGPLDRIHRWWLRRAAKLALCLIALSLSYGLAVSVLGLPRETPGMLALLLVLGLFTFLLLDRLLSRLILSWRRKWRRLLGFDRRK